MILPWPTPGRAVGTGPRGKMAPPGSHRPQHPATHPDPHDLRTAASTADLALSHSYSAGSDCELDGVEPAERGDLRGKASRAILGCGLAGAPRARSEGPCCHRVRARSTAWGGSQVAGTAMACNIGLAGTQRGNGLNSSALWIVKPARSTAAAVSRPRWHPGTRRDQSGVRRSCQRARLPLPRTCSRTISWPPGRSARR